ncbi:MAG: TIGR00730 family Rossman fold protein [Candidatus Doudnabacteria bacterium CG10_big_fil_rev_8_21_14_0_10_41_10]|uniref:Cytokinin riboside 5'-monophosphate phosphoribohydrolase n=1 Tax=Candidatus Doudnabacteria bacterium CG10_big_fil_rev_8_21_14_0_10_41_10 TaxID=1974551 RepID=A0A2H0VCW6_9BACT|nr:MAG: TIGR00730 family Rossman fold protein [Candidatus Doudnabacteria bacterium CG10_big_fil_rev_8_21_14_0_10_41_10]
MKKKVKPKALFELNRSAATDESKLRELLELHKEAEESSWRILKIQSEFVSGFEFLQKYKGRSISIFGSARIGFGSNLYKQAILLAYKLAKDKFAVITGGGPGIMEAANRGAYEAGGESVGINIQLKTEQRINKFVKESHAFEHFFVRKVMLSFASIVYIFFPGGYGTLDELFEMLTLIQTDKIEPIPVVLVGKEFWTPLMEWIKNTVYTKNRAITKDDLNIMKVVADADEAYQYIKKMKIRI